MNFIEWTEKHRIGHALLDSQHQMFFQMVQAAAQALGTEGPEAVRARLEFLVDYTRQHFEEEERMMREAAYPELDAHCAHHQRFRHEVELLQQRALDQPDMAPEVLLFAQTFLSTHIMEEDIRFGQHLARCSKA